MAKRSAAAVVTGASGGIGHELARCLVDRGFCVIATGRNQEALLKLAKECPEGTVVPIVADLSTLEGGQGLLRSLSEIHAPIEVLVNNAGIGRLGTFADLDISEQLAIVRVNVESVMLLTHALLQPMIERGVGYLMNVSSTAAFAPGPLMATYYASKSFLHSFSQALAVELRRSGVSVSTLCPGPTRSGFDRRAGVERGEAAEARMMDAARVARIGVDGMLAGRRLIIPGASNRMMTAASRLVPVALLSEIIRRFNSHKG